MIGPLLGAGVSALSAILGAGASQRQANIDWLSLLETKRANRKSEQLARSDRGDAYGNVIRYIPGIGFKYDLTPITEAILGAEQRERYANLSQDAPRNRAAAERMDERSQMGDEEFTRAFNEYKYRPRGSEAESVTEATDDLLNSRRKGLDQAAALLAKQLMRTGGSSQIASVFKQADDAYAGSLQEAILKGKQIGRQNFASEEAADMNRAQGELGFFKNIADQTTTSPVDFSSFNRDLSGRADNSLGQLIAAIESGRGASQNAYARYANSVGQTAPDLSGLAAVLSRLQFEDDEVDETSQPYDPWANLRNVGDIFNG